MRVAFDIPDLALKTYARLGIIQNIEPIALGQINKTYKIATDKEIFILQEISPIFETTIMQDLEAVSQHLIAKGLKAPELIKTSDEQRFIVVDGRVFRALVFIEGQTSSTMRSAAMASSAGETVGHFHQALMDFSYEYQSKRRHGGDYQFHRENLLTALKNRAFHDFMEVVEPLATAMLSDFDHLIVRSKTTKRHAHGDPKVSNMMFDAKDRAICLIDFDTLGQTGWSLELADALRSWCNPHKEDNLLSALSMEIAESAIKGYASIMRGHFTKPEIDEFVIHIQAITLCLAVRYLTDVLNENYFLHDQQRFKRPAEHNLLKAESMYRLFGDIKKKKDDLATMASDFLL